MTKQKKYWKDIVNWFKDNATPCFKRIKTVTGATEAEIKELEKKLGLTLPDDFKFELQMHNASDAVCHFEYNGLDIERMLLRWTMLNELKEEGKFKEYDPREIDKGNKLVKYTWWNKNWIPFAEDGGGNLICIDLDPGPEGKNGQVLKWEKHAGPILPFATSFTEYLRWYRDELLSGKYKYHENSGTFL